MTFARVRVGRTWLALAAAVLVSVTTADGVEFLQEQADDGSFGFSAPVACKEIKGFDDYVVLDDAALTCDEKLLVYFEPRHYKSARVGKKYEAHFTQDSRIRRRGEDVVLWSKKNLLDYKVASASHPEPIYLSNKIALKALTPGDYEYDVILRDAVGRSAEVVKTLHFTIVEAKREESPPTPKKKKPGSR